MKTATQAAYEQRILKVLLYIQEHLDHALDLDELAKLASFSTYHFHRVFRGMVGEPVMQHVRRLRLERAAYQLKNTDRSVTQIAFDGGYETHEAFTRAFSSTFGEPPSQFRKTHRRVPYPSVPSGVHYSPEGEIEAFTPITTEVESLDVRIEDAAPTPVVFIRHVGPYDQVGATWQRLMAFAFSNGLFGGMTKVLAIVHDDPEITSPKKLRYDACIVTRTMIEPASDVGVQEISGGTYAVVTYKGPYSELGAVYATMMGQWLPAHDREPSHPPCIEVYLNNPQQTAPEDLLTEIHVPLTERTP